MAYRSSKVDASSVVSTLHHAFKACLDRTRLLGGCVPLRILMDQKCVRDVCIQGARLQPLALDWYQILAKRSCKGSAAVVGVAKSQSYAAGASIPRGKVSSMLSCSIKAFDNGEGPVCLSSASLAATKRSSMSSTTTLQESFIVLSISLLRGASAWGLHTDHSK